MKIVIPFTLPGLNEYIDAERRHRQLAAEMKRQWQGYVLMALRRQLKRPLQEPVVMHYLWVEKDRRRDKDNVSAFGRKVIQDAMVQGRFLRNDGWQNILRFSDDFSVDKKRPRVEIIVEEGKEWNTSCL